MVPSMIHDKRYGALDDKINDLNCSVLQHADGLRSLRSTCNISTSVPVNIPVNIPLNVPVNVPVNVPDNVPDYVPPYANVASTSHSAVSKAVPMESRQTSCVQCAG